MADEKEKPGVLIYFDIREPLEVLSMEQRGSLFTAILDYACDGLAPLFDDPLLRMAWAIIKRGIDRDDIQYRTTILRRKYAAYCRYEKEAGRTPVTFDEWKDNDEEDAHASTCMHMHASASKSMPTTTSTTTTTTTSTSTTTSNNSSSGTPAAKPPDSPKQKTKKFVKPTLEEVAGYINQNDYSVNAERFFAYYESCGWQVKGRSMKDWKAAIRYWATSERQQPAAAPARKGNYFVEHNLAPSVAEYEAQEAEEDVDEEELAKMQEEMRRWSSGE